MRERNGAHRELNGGFTGFEAVIDRSGRESKVEDIDGFTFRFARRAAGSFQSVQSRSQVRLMTWDEIGIQAEEEDIPGRGSEVAPASSRA